MVVSSVQCTVGLVTSSLIRETTETESQNYGYKFGQEEETYNIVLAHGYFGRLNLPVCKFQQLKKFTLLPSSFPCCMCMVNLYGYLHNGIQLKWFQL